MRQNSFITYQVFTSLLIYISFVILSTHGQQELPRRRVEQLNGGYSIRLDRVTLSGLSTGGTFAETLYLAHSKLFSGIGIFSAFFWKCGDWSPDLEHMYATCGKPGGYDTKGAQPVPGGEDPANAITTARIYSNKKMIDNLDNIASDKIFIWQGTIDEFIRPDIGLSFLNIVEPHVYSPATQIYTKVQYAHHHFPTATKGTACPDQSDAYVDAFLGNCQYNGAYHMLDFLLSREGFELIRPRTDQGVRNLIIFDQSEFNRDADGNINDNGLANEGFLYVPSRCQSNLNKWGLTETCFLHIYFHGCFLTRDEVGTKHIIGSGLLQVAEKNNIIIVFAMAKVTTFNTGGCFDSFGYTGKNYATKKGSQVKVMRKILRRLMNDRSANDDDDDNGGVTRPSQHFTWPPSFSNNYKYKNFTTTKLP